MLPTAVRLASILLASAVVGFLGAHLVATGSLPRPSLACRDVLFWMGPGCTLVAVALLVWVVTTGRLVPALTFISYVLTVSLGRSLLTHYCGV